MNDIENDPAYRSWPAGVQELLRATFPGVIRQIRRNFFNLVSSPMTINVERVVLMNGIVFRLVFYMDQLWLNLNEPYQAFIFTLVFAILCGVCSEV